MPQDGEINFGAYTREQLEASLSRIDRQRYPINHSRLVLTRMCCPATSTKSSKTALGDVRLVSSLAPKDLARIYLSNYFLMFLTLGLYTPWAQVRLARYRLDSVVVEGPLDDFVASAAPAQAGATGEEVGEALDLDFGF